MHNIDDGFPSREQMEKLIDDALASLSVDASAAEKEVFVNAGFRALDVANDEVSLESVDDTEYAISAAEIIAAMGGYSLAYASPIAILVSLSLRLLLQNEVFTTRFFATFLHVIYLLRVSFKWARAPPSEAKDSKG